MPFLIIWHRGCYRLPKRLAMVGVMQMAQFMDDDIFCALDRISGEINGQPDSLRARVTTAPACVHFFYSYLIGVSANDWLPFLK